MQSCILPALVNAIFSALQQGRLLCHETAAALVQRGVVDTQLIAHDKEVYDIAWGGVGVFASVSADGSVRVFDLRYDGLGGICADIRLQIRMCLGCVSRPRLLGLQRKPRVTAYHLRHSKGASKHVAAFRDKEHSTIIYESPQPDTPLLRLGWNKQDPRYMATISMDSSRVVVLDIRCAVWLPARGLLSTPLVSI